MGETAAQGRAMEALLSMVGGDEKCMETVSIVLVVGVGES